MNIALAEVGNCGKRVASCWGVERRWQTTACWRGPACRAHVRLARGHGRVLTCWPRCFRNTTSQLQRRLSCCLRGPLQRMRRPLLSGLHPATSLRSRLQSEARFSNIMHVLIFKPAGFEQSQISRTGTVTVGDTSGMVEAEKNARGSGRWRPPGPGSSACAALSTGASALLPPGLSLPQRRLLGPGLRSAPPIPRTGDQGGRGRPEWRVAEPRPNARPWRERNGLSSPRRCLLRFRPSPSLFSVFS